MSSLEYLDMSYNNLYGTIPSSLVGLSFLSKFSVAYNNLYGRIPSGGQFGTFPKSSFEGNPELCSDWVNSPCEVSFEQPSKGNGNSDHEEQPSVKIKISVGVGFASDFVSVIVFRIIFNMRKCQ
ncbi:hypothetical protein QQ045_012790 [Rhodiola kirilowii]